MCIFRKQHSPLLKTLYNVPQFSNSKSSPKRYYVFCLVTSLRQQSRLYLPEWDRAREERTFDKFCASKPTAAAEPEVLKNDKQCFFMPTPTKKAKKCQTMTYMPNTIFSCQAIFEKAKYLEFGLKNVDLATLRCR